MRNRNSWIRVLIVADREVMRLGLKQMMRGALDIKIVGEVNTDEMLEFTRIMFPDVIVMEAHTENMDFLEMVKKIVSINADIKILFMISSSEDKYLSQLLQHVVFSFVTSNITANEVVQTIRLIYQGERYICPRLAQHVIFKQANSVITNKLSAREKQIVSLVVDGYITKQIACNLGLNVKTVNSYCYRIFKKLKIKGRVALVRLAMRESIV